MKTTSEIKKIKDDNFENLAKIDFEATYLNSQNEIKEDRLKSDFLMTLSRKELFDYDYSRTTRLIIPHTDDDIFFFFKHIAKHIKAFFSIQLDTEDFTVLKEDYFQFFIGTDKKDYDGEPQGHFTHLIAGGGYNISEVKSIIIAFVFCEDDYIRIMIAQLLLSLENSCLTFLEKGINVFNPILYNIYSILYAWREVDNDSFNELLKLVEFENPNIKP